VKPPGYRNLFKLDVSRTEGGYHLTVEALERFRFIVSFTDDKRNVERMKRIWREERSRFPSNF
jgi:hypothetical protein